MPANSYIIISNKPNTRDTYTSQFEQTHETIVKLKIDLARQPAIVHGMEARDK